MPARKIFSAVLGVLFLFLFPSFCFASVVINEIYPNPPSGGNEWAELYNSGSSSVDLTGWYLQDKANHKKELTSLGDIAAGSLLVLEGDSDGWLLNNSSEDVFLKNDLGEQQDSYSYSSAKEGKSIGRQTDGDSNWIVFDSPTKGSSNEATSGVSLPSPSSDSSPNPNTSSQAATYKINEVKDQNDIVLSSVKVYVDNVYLHHFAPETLIFCEGCKCDTIINCGFGQHVIKLEKNGYDDWSETKDFTTGSYFEVNPKMEKSISEESGNGDESPSNPSPSPSRSKAPSVGATTKVVTTTKTGGQTKKPSLISLPFLSTSSSEVLGEETESAEAEEEKKGLFASQFFLPAVLSLVGLVFLGVSFYPQIIKFLPKK